jgi:REP element-mobilizing transposase RayT
MARPLRIDVAGAWYHVRNRGHRGGTLFRNDADRRRFLGALAELPERFGVEVHAFVLMDNHYHLLVRTPQPSLQRRGEVFCSSPGGGSITRDHTLFAVNSTLA